MDVLLDELGTHVLRQVQERVVPTLEKATQALLAPRPPPSSTDLLYITPRLIVSSQPARALHPTYRDEGRDDTTRHRKRKPSQQQQQQSSSSVTSSQPKSPFRRRPNRVTQPSLERSLSQVSSLTNSRNSSLNSLSNLAQDSIDEDCDGVLALVAEGSYEDDTGMPLEETDEDVAAAPQAPTKDSTANKKEDTGASAIKNNLISQAIPEGREGEDATSTERVQMESPQSSLPMNDLDNPQEAKNTIEENEVETAGGNRASTQQTKDEPDAPGLETDVSTTTLATNDVSPALDEKSCDDENDRLSNSPKNISSPLRKVNDDTNSSDTGKLDVSKTALIDPDLSKALNALQEPQAIVDYDEQADSTAPESIGGSSADRLLIGEDQTDDDAMHDTPPQHQMASEVSIPTNDTENDQTDVSGKPQVQSVPVNFNDDEDCQHAEAPDLPKQPQHHFSKGPASAGGKILNSPESISTYLENRHGRDNYLAFSLMNEPPDDRTLVLFRRQIVQLGWWSPCLERSETPSIPKVIQACYAIHAYLSLHESNVAMVYCANGKTRTAVVVACYLRFAGFFEQSHLGFLHFLKCRGIGDPEAAWKNVPPSLKRFFQQFDTTLDVGGFYNRKPLLLRAIALQGVPVEDKPCLDIWDSLGDLIFTSHPETWGKVDDGTGQLEQQSTSQWADEEGFYRVNTVVDGDFLVLCRFGGSFAEQAIVHDPSKILFRYANTTGFMSGGYPFELSPSKVDLSRQYAQFLDEDDFLVTLLFQSEWEASCHQGDSALPSDTLHRLKEQSFGCSDEIYRVHERGSLVEGWNAIQQFHSAKPLHEDIEALKRNCIQEKTASDTLITVAMQLANFETKRTELLLSHNFPPEWSGEERHAPGFPPSNLISEDETASEKRAKSVLEVLNGIDSSGDAAAAEFLRFDREGDGHRRTTCLTKQSKELHSSTNETPSSRMPKTELASGGISSISPLVYPRSGEILQAFGQQEGHPGHLWRSTNNDTHSSTEKEIVPFIEHRKLPRQHTSRQKPQHWDLPEGSEERNEARQDCVLQHFSTLSHAGVRLEGLRELFHESRHWTSISLDEESSEEEEDVEEKGNVVPTSREATMNQQAKEQQEKKWDKARKIEAETKEEKLKTEDLKRKEKDAARVEEETKKQSEGNPVAEDGSGDPPLKDDPDYAKYFKMLKMGMPKAQVIHAMTRDEKDVTVLELDPAKSLKAQQQNSEVASDLETPLKDDPEYSKYFKMLKMGLPIGAVKNALTRDDKDPSVMDLDPNKSLKAQTKADTGTDDGPALKDDPEFSKYFKMLSMGLPIGAVKNALGRDGKDPAIMDLDPNKSFKSQQESAEEEGPPLKDDPEFSKYFKMLSMGLPVGAVKNALGRDGKDPAIMDLDPNKSLASQQVGAAKDSGPPLKDDPEYSKYFKMLGMGLPIGAVKNAISRDGKDPTVMDLDPNKSVASQLGSSQAEEKDTGVPLKDDPEYAKYFKMLGMGLPPGAVKNAIERDGKDPSILDLDKSKSVAFQLKKSSKGTNKPMKKKKRVRRKKIYWNQIDPTKLQDDSMWSIVKDAVAMDTLNYDKSEFESLFTESADPADKKKKKETKTEAKKLVQVIDPKKSMNGAIVLARLKTDHSKIAEYVNLMEHGKFDSTQLGALKEYLPDDDERRGLIAYLKPGESSPDKRDMLYSDLSETEKYMVSMMEVSDALAKCDALLFRSIFKTRFEEITDAVQTLNSACDELRTSERLRKVFAMILTVVNQINTGGEGKMAMGFTLDSLMKLNEAKAFDKKTSVLHYVVKLVKKNDKELLSFDSDLSSVSAAESVLLDNVATDIKNIQGELLEVHETVKNEAERLEAAGELVPMSLSDLKEQKTTVHNDGTVLQYNKVDHLSGRTSMERFTLNAKVACDHTVESTENVKKKYAALLGYFGEDSQLSTGDFFTTLRRFIFEWQKGVEQVEAIEKKLAKEKKRAAKANSKNSKKSDKKEAKPQGSNGIAAIAAAAAASKSKKKVPQSSTASGIAAVAAAAANKNSRKAAQGPIGIAAIAAAAAAGKNSKKSDEEEATPKAPIGIAAMAAAAAASKKSDKEEAKPSGPTGIAAMAAAAAASKNSKKSSQGPTGIAAMAAAAAARKNSNKSGKEEVKPQGLTGIAAMAAAAAESKNSKQSNKEESKPQAPIGIAAMAAAAAASKSEKIISQSSSAEKQSSFLASLSSKTATPSSVDDINAPSDSSNNRIDKSAQGSQGNGPLHSKVSEESSQSQSTQDSGKHDFAGKAAEYRKKKEHRRQQSELKIANANASAASYELKKNEELTLASLATETQAENPEHEIQDEKEEISRDVDVSVQKNASTMLKTEDTALLSPTMENAVAVADLGESGLGEQGEINVATITLNEIDQASAQHIATSSNAVRPSSLLPNSPGEHEETTLRDVDSKPTHSNTMEADELHPVGNVKEDSLPETNASAQEASSIDNIHGKEDGSPSTPPDATTRTEDDSVAARSEKAQSTSKEILDLLSTADTHQQQALVQMDSTQDEEGDDPANKPTLAGESKPIIVENGKLGEPIAQNASTNALSPPDLQGDLTSSIDSQQQSVPDQCDSAHEANLNSGIKVSNIDETKRVAGVLASEISKSQSFGESMEQNSSAKGAAEDSFVVQEDTEVVRAAAEVEDTSPSFSGGQEQVTPTQGDSAAATETVPVERIQTEQARSEDGADTGRPHLPTEKNQIVIPRSPTSDNDGELSTHSPTVSESPPQGGLVSASSPIGIAGGRSLASFLSSQTDKVERSDILRQNFDESSVAQMAGDLQRNSGNSHMAEPWAQPDSITTWMGWADQAIKSSDTESVRGLELPRDLIDVNTFDDDSTIASYFEDDLSIISTNMTPINNDSHVFSFENEALSSIQPAFEFPSTSEEGGSSHYDYSYDSDKEPAKAPTEAVYDTSGAQLVEFAASPTQRSPSHIDPGLSFGTTIGLDAGLSFGAGDAGLDDGLGFGGGGESDDPPTTPTPQDGRALESPDTARKWFSWRK